MSNLQRRMDALEAAQARRQYRMIAATTAEYRLSTDELMEEAHEFFALRWPSNWQKWIGSKPSYAAPASPQRIWPSSKRR
jgi:hypothetical protein